MTEYNHGEVNKKQSVNYCHLCLNNIRVVLVVLISQEAIYFRNVSIKPEEKSL